MTNSHSIFSFIFYIQLLNLCKNRYYFPGTIICYIYIVLYWLSVSYSSAFVPVLCCPLMAKEIYSKYSSHWGEKSKSHSRKSFFFSRNTAFRLEFLFSVLINDPTSQLMCQLLWERHCHIQYSIANLGYISKILMQLKYFRSC